MEVCANVTTDRECPIEFDAVVELYTRGATAGVVVQYAHTNDAK